MFLLMLINWRILLLLYKVMVGIQNQKILLLPLIMGEEWGQCCEETVSVELRYINEIYYYY